MVKRHAVGLTVETLHLTSAERRKAEQLNAILAHLPRLKTGGWRLAAGQTITPIISQAASSISASLLRRKGLSVSTSAANGPAGPVPLRLLEPESVPRGLVLDFHGGGWVVGSAALNDPVNKHLVAAGFAVASVDYRLLNDSRGVGVADAVADCTSALRWSLTEGESRFGANRPVVIGESAGAHLAALALLTLPPPERERFLGCIFVQGVFDLAGTPSARAANSETLLFDGPNLASDLGRLTPDLDEAGLRSPLLSPLYADLEAVPPALFIAGEQDPLRDDSLLMARAWSSHAETLLLDIPTAPHGFQHFGAPTADRAQAAIRSWLDHLLRSKADPDSVDGSNR